MTFPCAIAYKKKRVKERVKKEGRKKGGEKGENEKKKFL